MGGLGLIPGLGRSPGEGKGYPLQYSGLENSRDSLVHGVAKSRAWLSNSRFHKERWKHYNEFSLKVHLFNSQNCPLLWNEGLLIFVVVRSLISHSDFLPPRDGSMPGFPVLHHLPVCSDSCALCQWCHPTSHPLSTLSPPALILGDIKLFILSFINYLCMC